MCPGDDGLEPLGSHLGVTENFLIFFLPFAVAKFGDLWRIGLQVDAEIFMPCRIEMKFIIDWMLQLDLAFLQPFQKLDLLSLIVG